MRGRGEGNVLDIYPLETVSLLQHNVIKLHLCPLV